LHIPLLAAPLSLLHFRILYSSSNHFFGFGIMAEVGVIAGFAAGLKLSVCLYDFASNIGSAGKEIKSVAREASLLCRFLKQVQSMLQKPRLFEYRQMQSSLPKTGAGRSLASLIVF
jgi:hypothetical protein